MAAATIILRERLAPLALFDMLVRSFGRITIAEIGLASVFTVAYVAVGWWAPAALAIVVLLVWPGEGFEGIDPLMKLPRNRQFQRDFDSAVARTRRGMATGGVLLMLDLDHFGEINKDDGKHVGDEVLAEVGERLRAIVRTTDLVGRLGGDELAMFYRGEVDESAARRLASRVEQAICAPIMTTAGVATGRRFDRRPHRPAGTRHPLERDAHGVGGSRHAGPEEGAEAGPRDERDPFPPVWTALDAHRRGQGRRATPLVAASPLRPRPGVSARWACRRARRPGACPPRSVRARTA